MCVPLSFFFPPATLSGLWSDLQVWPGAGCVGGRWKGIVLFGPSRQDLLQSTARCSKANHHSPPPTVQQIAYHREVGREIVGLLFWLRTTRFTYSKTLKALVLNFRTALRSVTRMYSAHSGIGRERKLTLIITLTFTYITSVNTYKLWD